MTNLFDKVQTAKHLKEREDLINLKDDWLIDTLMPSSQAGILVAPFKSFKSSLAMHMALMVSQGFPFFGYDTKRSKTLYIDNEDTDRELNKRLRNKDNEIKRERVYKRVDWRRIERLNSERNSIKRELDSTYAQLRRELDRNNLTAYGPRR